MKKLLFFIVLGFIFSCKQKQVIVEQTMLIKSNAVNVDLIEEYVNGVDSYIYHINLNTKDSDSLSFDELNSLKKSKHFTKNITEKDITLRNNKVVKVKYKDFLENNFIKIKSFYYDNDALVCIKVYELLPTLNGESKVYNRRLYYNNNVLLLDTKENDGKYQNESLLSFGVEKLEEVYQSKIND
jgi:hypothetical protein